MEKNRLAIIDNSLDHSVYNPIRHWTMCLETYFDVFHATDNHFPEIQDFTHIILTGSEASIMEREKWALNEIALILEALEKGVSLLGSCYGHQLLAVALAGPQHVQRCADPEIGWIAIEINGTDGFLGKKRRAFCFSSHLDEVKDLPGDFRVLASSERCQVQAFRFKDKPVWGLQMHPEMNINEAQWYLRQRIEQKHEPMELFLAAMNSPSRDSGLIDKVVQNFLG